MKKLLLAGVIALLSSAACADAPQSAYSTVNGSVVIAAGNTFQTVVAANSRLRSLTIQNNNTNGDNCWVFVGGGTATKPTAILLGQGGSYQRYYPYVPADAIQATCAATSDTLYVDTQ